MNQVDYLFQYEVFLMKSIYNGIDFDKKSFDRLMQQDIHKNILFSLLEFDKKHCYCLHGPK